MSLEQEQDQVRYSPVHVSLQRRNMLLGCETEAVVCLMGLVVFLTLVAPKPPTFLLGIVLFFVGLAVLRRMAKRDPKMLGVLMRHFRYQSEYHAWPSLGTPPLSPRKESR